MSQMADEEARHLCDIVAGLDVHQIIVVTVRKHYLFNASPYLAHDENRRGLRGLSSVVPYGCGTNSRWRSMTVWPWLAQRSPPSAGEF